MQELKSRRRNIAWLVLALVFPLMQSCGWKRTMKFNSPSKRAAIEIWQTRIANEWGTRVQLVTSQRNLTVFENRREALVYFVHVYWSPDETRVGVMATGTNIWYVAFDTRTAKELPFDQIRNEVAESIRKTYALAKGGDPIGWAGSADAHAAFFKLHPEIQVSYR